MCNSVDSKLQTFVLVSTIESAAPLRSESCILSQGDAIFTHYSTFLCIILHADGCFLRFRAEDAAAECERAEARAFAAG